MVAHEFTGYFRALAPSSVVFFPGCHEVSSILLFMCHHLLSHLRLHLINTADHGLNSLKLGAGRNLMLIFSDISSQPKKIED